jgi:hypothetical protein
LPRLGGLPRPWFGRDGIGLFCARPGGVPVREVALFELRGVLPVRPGALPLLPGEVPLCPGALALLPGRVPL